MTICFALKHLLFPLPQLWQVERNINPSFKHNNCKLLHFALLWLCCCFLHIHLVYLTMFLRVSFKMTSLAWCSYGCPNKIADCPKTIAKVLIEYHWMILEKWPVQNYQKGKAINFGMYFIAWGLEHKFHLMGINKSSHRLMCHTAVSSSTKCKSQDNAQNMAVVSFAYFVSKEEYMINTHTAF